MKIVNETLRAGRHAVVLLAENASDEYLVRQVWRLFQQRANVRASATLEHDAAEKFPALRLEESE